MGSENSWVQYGWEEEKVSFLRQIEQMKAPILQALNGPWSQFQFVIPQIWDGLTQTALMDLNLNQGAQGCMVWERLFGHQVQFFSNGPLWMKWQCQRTLFQESMFSHGDGTTKPPLKFG